MEAEQFLRLLAERVFTARLKDGARLLDGSDFRTWLIELADECAAAETPEDFLRQIDGPRR